MSETKRARFVDGLSSEGSGRYASPASKNQLITMTAVGVDSGVDVNKDSTVRFRWKIDKDKLGR